MVLLGDTARSVMTSSPPPDEVGAWNGPTKLSDFEVTSTVYST
jgi:hypothetical protein